MDDLLRILESDSRKSPEMLARMTGRTEEDIREAIADYEERGIIKQYATVIDWDRAGRDHVLAFIDIKVSPAREVGFDDVAERIYRFEEVHSVWLVSGDFDLRVLVEGKTVQEVGMLVAQKLATIERVQGTATHFLLKRYKENGVVFVEENGDPRLSVSP
jgi:DNA-binding Lrp family transcriptional regulator